MLSVDLGDSSGGSVGEVKVGSSTGGECEVGELSLGSSSRAGGEGDVVSVTRGEPENEIYKLYIIGLK